jgi:hypothetical protein
MKKHINLLIQKNDYKKKETIFYRLRIITGVLAIISIISLFIIFFLQQQINSEYQKLLSKKEDYLRQITKKKEIEKQILYFNEKSNVFKQILKNDVNFLPYYRILRAYLLVSTESADINFIKYDNKKTVEFVLSFSNYIEMYNSLSNFEDKKFLTIFDNLILNSINFSEMKTKNYQLSLKGRLKQLSVEQ